jgi:GNAT superfamily N-acetyltransferase
LAAVSTAQQVSIGLATNADIAGLVASNEGLFAEDAAVRDHLRNPGWPAARGAEGLTKDLANPDRLVLAAKSDGLVVGHLIGGFQPASDMWLAPLAILITMHVGGATRGQGVGSRLMERFVSWGRERGAGQLRVTAYTANEAAVRFYQRHGFAPLETTLAMEV